MSSYVKICNKCGTKNSVNIDNCSCGESLVLIIPTEVEGEDDKLTTCTKENQIVTSEGKKFRRCKVCGTINYLDNGRDVRKCSNPNCLNDELYRSKIEIECDRNVSASDVNTEKDEQVDNEKSIQLISRGTSNVLSISSKGAILGRMGTEYADFFTNYEYVGRIHCEIKFFDGHWQVKDMSTNGTQINGKRIPKDEFVVLRTGDLLSLANAHFEVRF